MKLTRVTKLTTPQQAQNITIDAAGQSLGRLATKIATYLRGKHRSTFSPIKLANVKVVVNNAAKVAINPKALTTKQYRRYSGWPGGVKHTSVVELLRKDASQIIRIAVSRMLPRNHLRAKQLKNLTINK